MAYWIINSLIVFALCVLLAGVLIPQILLIAYRRKLFDEVDERKIHKGLIPRLGGIAFVPVILLSIALTIAANIISGSPQFGNVFFNNSLLMIALFCSLQLLYLVGIADDLIGIKYRAKFVVQIVCAVLLISAGCWFTTLAGSLGIENMPSWMGMPFTAIVIVFIINAMNLIDGVDGLSSGFCITACAIFSAVFFKAGDMMMFILSMALIGALIPFFMHNVFGERSKMFIGDGGTLVMGAVMSIFVVRVLGVGSPVAQFWDQSHAGMSAVAFTLAVLCVPVFDTLRVMVTRMLQGRSPFHPDKTHLHHMFIDLGFSHVGTTFSIILLNLTVVAVWWASVSMGCSLDVQLYVVILFGSLFTIFLYPAVAAAKRRNAALYRALTAAGRMTHFERKGFFLLLRKAMDRM